MLVTGKKRPGQPSKESMSLTEIFKVVVRYMAICTICGYHTRNKKGWPTAESDLSTHVFLKHPDRVCNLPDRLVEWV